MPSLKVSDLFCWYLHISILVFLMSCAGNPDHNTSTDRAKKSIEFNDEASKLQEKVALVRKLQKQTIMPEAKVFYRGTEEKLVNLLDSDTVKMILYIPSNVCGDCYGASFRILDDYLAHYSNKDNFFIVCSMVECRKNLADSVRQSYKNSLLCRLDTTTIFNGLSVDVPILCAKWGSPSRYQMLLS